MRPSLIAVIALAVLACLPHSLKAQAFNLESDKQRWSIRASEHFDVLFTPGSSKAAEWAARYAERSLFDLQVMLDFRSEARFSLIYFSSAQEAALSPLIQAPALGEPGLFTLPRRTAVIIHGEHTKDLYTAVRTAVAKLLIEELSFGSSVNQVIQNRLLLYLPPWYIEGLSAYLGEGWTPQDESWVATLQRTEMAELALENAGPASPVLRKSIWYYIAREYGQHRIAEIVYLVNVNNSVDAGIIHVLGVSLSNFTSRWKDFLLNRALRNEEGRKPLNQITDLWKLPARPGKRLLAAVPDYQGDQVALYAADKSKNQAFLYQLQSQRLEALPLPAYDMPLAAHPHRFAPPLAWTYEGDRLATAFPQDGQWQIGIMAIADKSLTWYALPRDIRQCGRIAWAHDGRRILFAGLKDGFFQVFLFEEGKTEQLTFGDADHIDPVWSLDDQFIFFASNRIDNREETGYTAYRNNFDLYKIPLAAGGDTLVKLTYTPTINERWPSTPNSFEIAFLTDEAGVLNMARVNIFLNEVHFSTNLGQGPVWATMNDQYASFMAPEGNGLAFYRAPAPSVLFNGVPAPSPLRQEYLITFQEEIQKEQYYRVLDRKAKEPPKPEIQPVAKPDSSKPSPVVRFYFFDDEAAPYTQPAQEPERKPASVPLPVTPARQEQIKRRLPPTLETIQVGAAKGAPADWSPTHVGATYGFDPVAGWNIGFLTGFEDRLQRQRIWIEARPFMNFKNMDYSLRYAWLKNRLDLTAGISYSMRSFSESFSARSRDSLLFRFQDLRLEGGAVYPIHAFAAVYGDVGMHFQTRTDQKLRRLNALDQREPLAYTRVGLLIDRTERSEFVIRNGFFFNGYAESLYRIRETSLGFVRLNATARAYKPLARHLVLASQFSAGLNLTNRNLQYLLGGADAWMFGLKFDGQPNNSNNARILLDPDIFSFSYRQQLNPMRGFSPMARGGARFLLWNTELRVPITRLMQQSLNTNRLYNFELIPFIDAGTTWISGNPFSQRNPTDTQFLTNGAVSVELQTLRSPFLIGFGSGFRMNLVGYSVRFDLAWGLEDNTVQAPMLITSLGKTF